MNEFSWVGSQKHYIDELNVLEFSNNMVIGRFGGNSSAGQYKNEDGCLIWADEDWEFVILLDAHNTAQSAELIISTIKYNQEKLIDLLNLRINQAFHEVNNFLLSVFSSKEFREECQKIKGETACLIVCRKGRYIFWLSIGDCALYLNHPELSALGEYQQNHRSFYEWIGQVSAFNYSIPCFSTGIKEMRKGKTQLFLTTDGLLECPNANLSSPKDIFHMIESVPIKEGVIALLNKIKEKNVRDSTTIISWEVINTDDALMPSDIGSKKP
ncbi:protein phosphatase 2C domain-containing protein [Pullulanibacillus sp. KACC 23026]|uniref:protein phosphatase 2C domain-containing protein n=1 Tax=Pullulanibacillus sp. KACC 23026 TaxID=3028315 RepID=UPI0023B18ACF|nr:protein phosphatase 2C domain-containing protein [Pullulanibacillus sp. KACC 23026]WEG13258.1 protein phosphatase 2C domain-containing protein [Pullulanibacillus sp. KACC 23026]